MRNVKYSVACLGLVAISLAMTNTVTAQQPAIKPGQMVCQFLCTNLNMMSPNQQTMPEAADFVKNPEYAFSCQYDPPGSDSSNCRSMTDKFITEAVQNLKARCESKNKAGSADVFKPAYIMCMKAPEKQ